MSQLGRLLMPALRADADGGFGHERAAIAEALALGVGGFITFGGTVATVGQLTRELAERAGRPLLVASDLERGAGQQVVGATELPPPLALAALDDPAAIRRAGHITAAEARHLGINWVFAPVADLDALDDNPIVQTRAFGREPARVAAAVRAWVTGCERAGALACAKHFPGHGRTMVDSHVDLPVVEAARETLVQEDLLPFAAAADAGVASMMTAHVAYPALDASGLPATLARPILEHLRRDMGYDGVVVTDALIMDGARAGRTEEVAAVEALAAGADLLLYPTDAGRVMAALVAAVEAGTLPVARVQEALRRYDRAVRRASRSPAPFETGFAAEADALADRALAAGAAGVRPALRAPLDLVVVDDDAGGPYQAGPTDVVAAALRALGVALGPGGSRVALLFAEPRAWKGRAGLGHATQRALAPAADRAEVALCFAHPRFVRDVPPRVPAVVAWHRQPLMQRAAARWLHRALTSA